MSLIKRAGSGQRTGSFPVYPGSGDRSPWKPQLSHPYDGVYGACGDLVAHLGEKIVCRTLASAFSSSLGLHDGALRIRHGSGQKNHGYQHESGSQPITVTTPWDWRKSIHGGHGGRLPE